MASFVFDQALAISLSDLNKLKLFKQKEGFTELELMIKRTNCINETSGIVRIGISTLDANSFLQLTFNAGGEIVNQKFDLIKSQTVPPKSYRWMLICPLTGSKCRKVYLEKDRFKSRRAIKGFYEINTIRYGHKRAFFKRLNNFHKIKKISLEIDLPYAKPFYKGVATNRNRRSTEAKNILKNL